VSWLFCRNRRSMANSGRDPGISETNRSWDRTGAKAMRREPSPEAGSPYTGRPARSPRFDIPQPDAPIHSRLENRPPQVPPTASCVSSAECRRHPMFDASTLVVQAAQWDQPWCSSIQRTN
jgi:hypothetical protein